MAWNLRRLRTARDISQESLAVDAGVDRTYVGAVERQEFNPTVDLLERMVTALGADLADLFVEPEPGSDPPRPLRPGRHPGEG